MQYVSLYPIYLDFLFLFCFFALDVSMKQCPLTISKIFKQRFLKAIVLFLAWYVYFSDKGTVLHVERKHQ